MLIRNLCTRYTRYHRRRIVDPDHPEHPCRHPDHDQPPGPARGVDRRRGATDDGAVQGARHLLHDDDPPGARRRPHPHAELKHHRIQGRQLLPEQADRDPGLALRPGLRRYRTGARYRACGGA